MNSTNTTSQYEALKQSFPALPEKVKAKTSTRPRRPLSGNKDYLVKVCVDGERTAHLTKLAGSLIAKGYSLDEVKTNALDWNSRNQPPLDDAKVEFTCESIMVTHQLNHPDMVVQGAVLPLFDPETARVTNYLHTEAPPRRYLLKDFIPAGIVGAVVARGGSSKTQFLLQLGVSIAGGISLCGNWEPEQSGKVLILLAEDDEGEIHRRIQGIVRQLALSAHHE